MAEKIQPQDLESELATLGSMMMSKDAVALVAGQLKPEHFYKPSHANIYKAIVELYKENEPIDLVTVANQLKKEGTLEKAGGRSFLAEILDCVPTASNATKYADIVFEKAMLRRLISAGSEIISDAFDDAQEPAQVLDNAQKMINDISREGIQDDFVPLKSILNVVFDELQSTSLSKDKVLGIPTGFPDLDKMTSGFQKGDLVILAARPSIGKTTLALNFASHAAISKKIPVAIFSCEMPKEQLAMRLLCAEARLDSSRLRTSNLQDHEYKDLNQAFGKLAEAPIYIDDTPGISPLELRAKCRRLQNEADVKLIIIDYLQLMRGGKKRIESRFQEISEIVRETKAFAKESGIPIIALSQLSRDIEKRQDKRPLLSDLRESGEIEQTADLIMFLHREEGYQDTKMNVSPLQLVIAKQRNGPTGDINLIFKRDISKFAQGTLEHAPPIPG